MEINIEPINTSQINSKTDGIKTDGAKEIKPADLSDVFKDSQIRAQITDIRENNITVKLSNGQELNAALLGNSQARIGDIVNFILKNLPNGELALEMENPTETASRMKVMVDALKQAGLKINNENLNLVSALLDNNMAVNKDTILQLNQALKIFGADNIQKAVYLLANSARVTPDNAAALNGLIAGELKISTQINNIVESILNIRDASVRENIINTLLKEPNITTDRPAVAFIGRTDANVPNIPNVPVPPSSAGLLNTVPHIPQREGRVSHPPEQAPTQTTQTATAQTTTIQTAPTQTTSTQITATQITTAQAAERPLQQITAQAIEPSPGQSIGREITATVAEAAEQGANNLLKTARFDLPITMMSRQELKDLILDRFLLRPHTFNAEEFAKTVALIKIITERAREQLPPEETRLSAQIRSLSDSINFISQIRESIYVQIPLIINDRQTTAELFIFKNKKKKNSATGAVSALISIDTAFLGKFEVYMVKDNKNISCQFRLSDEKVGELVGENINALQEELKKYDYILSGYSFKALTESFTLLDKEPGIENNGPAPELIKYMFDVRT